MKNTIIHFYWKLFFAAYWTAYNLGEKDDPQINATWFVVLSFAINCLSLLFIGIYINGGILPYYNLWIFLSFLIPAIINFRILFSKRNGYKKKLTEYTYLSKLENKGRRHKILVFTFAISFVVMGWSMFLFGSCF